jgi:catechol 2,3-dioxygenase-like lactoylglutathione lyase family enzyme
MIDSLVGRVAGVSYLHIPARDPRASSAFYRDVFGWPLHGADDDPHFSDGTAGRDDRRQRGVDVGHVDVRVYTVLAGGGLVGDPPADDLPSPTSTAGGWDASPIQPGSSGR